MNRIFDIHNHMIPGVDDGSKDIEMSKEMFKIAAKSGTTDIILTPHNKPHVHSIHLEELKEKTKMLQGVVDEMGLDLKLYYGNEVYYRMDVIESIRNGRASTMAGSRYVLLEFTPPDEWDYIKHGTYELLSGGYIPIIAHVERYRNAIKDISRVDELINMGAYIQINTDSILGKYGHDIKKKVFTLLEDRKVSFIASDAHDIKKRTPDISKAVKIVTKKFGEDYAGKIFETNPVKVLNDEYI